MQIAFFGIESNIVIEEKIFFDDFIILPNEKAGIKYQSNFKEILSITVLLDDFKNAKNDLNCIDKAFAKKIVRIAQVKLNKLFYRLSLFFKIYIFLRYPVHFEFMGEIYKIEGNFPPNRLMSNYDFENYEYKTVISKVFPLKIQDFIKIKKITKKYLHLCYLYHSVRNGMIDLNFRLLSAWKFIEEFIELNYKSEVRGAEIPSVFFNKVLKKLTISAFDYLIDQNSKICVIESKYNEKYLKDFYDEIRLLIAHHKRSKTKNIKEKKYTPGIDLKKDFKFSIALEQMIPLIDSIRDFIFDDSPEFIKLKNYKVLSSKTVKFPKRIK